MVLAEKDSLAERAFVLHDRIGVTVIVTGGTPPLVGSEALAEDLRARGVEEVRILSYCDFDMVG